MPPQASQDGATTLPLSLISYLPACQLSQVLHCQGSRDWSGRALAIWVTECTSHSPAWLHPYPPSCATFHPQSPSVPTVGLVSRRLPNSATCWQLLQAIQAPRFHGAHGRVLRASMPAQRHVVHPPEGTNPREECNVLEECDGLYPYHCVSQSPPIFWP